MHNEAWYKSNVTPSITTNLRYSLWTANKPYQSFHSALIMHWTPQQVTHYTLFDYRMHFVCTISFECNLFMIILVTDFDAKLIDQLLSGGPFKFRAIFLSHNLLCNMPLNLMSIKYREKNERCHTFFACTTSRSVKDKWIHLFAYMANCFGWQKCRGEGKKHDIRTPNTTRSKLMIDTLIFVDRACVCGVRTSVCNDILPDAHRKSLVLFK